MYDRILTVHLVFFLQQAIPNTPADKIWHWDKVKMTEIMECTFLWTHCIIFKGIICDVGKVYVTQIQRSKFLAVATARWITIWTVPCNSYQITSLKPDATCIYMHNMFPVNSLAIICPVRGLRDIYILCLDFMYLLWSDSKLHFL